MRIVDCNNCFDDDHELSDFDFCIIGAGIAGIILADQLSREFKIVLVESGDFHFDDKLQKLNELSISGLPIRENKLSRVRQFGGACNLWAGRCLKLDSIDFERRDWIANSGWPIQHEDISKHYQKLNEEYGMADYHLFNFQSEDNFDDLSSAISRDPYLSVNKAIWGKSVARFGQKSNTYKNISKRKSLTLLKNVTVRKLFDISDKIRSCELINQNKGTLHLKAKKFILAAGGIENARILLSSTSQNENGIGNIHDNVGRYYMDHPTSVRGNVSLQRKVYQSSMFSRPVKDGRFKNVIRFSDEHQKKNKLTNNHVELSVQYPSSYEETYSFMIEIAKILLRKGGSVGNLNLRGLRFAKVPEIIYLLTPNEIFPHFIGELYYKMNRYLKRPIKCNALVLTHHFEQTPNRSSRIQILNDYNSFGIHKVNLNWEVGLSEMDTAFALEKQVIDSLIKSGWVDPKVKPHETDKLRDASHHMGTTRMALSPEDGVVDVNCQVHGVKNLFIAGSSIFPTSGSANPTYTIAALTLRLAEYLRSSHGKV